MTLTLLQAPAVEPVTLTQAKQYLRLDGDQEDTLINALIVSARMLIESTISRALITQKWQLTLPVRATLPLPLSPVQSVETVFSRKGGEETELASSAYTLEDDCLSFATLPNGDRLRIVFLAGYGDGGDTVPAPLQQAILHLTAHWFENRGEGMRPGSAMPAAVSLLLSPYKKIRL